MKEKVELWVVGEISNESWTIVGVTDSEEKAASECKNEDYFIGPVILGEMVHDNVEEWPGSYYPLLEPKSER